MDEETANLIGPKVEAIRAFIKNVKTAGGFLPDNSTRANYRSMYADIKNILDDPNLETYAPPLPHLGTTNNDATLLMENQIRLMGNFQS